MKKTNLVGGTYEGELKCICPMTNGNHDSYCPLFTNARAYTSIGYACLGLPGCNHQIDEPCKCECHKSEGVPKGECKNNCGMKATEYSYCPTCILLIIAGYELKTATKEPPVTSNVRGSVPNTKNKAQAIPERESGHIATPAPSGVTSNAGKKKCHEICLGKHSPECEYYEPAEEGSWETELKSMYGYNCMDFEDRRKLKNFITSLLSEREAKARDEGWINGKLHAEECFSADEIRSQAISSLNSALEKVADLIKSRSKE